MVATGHTTPLRFTQRVRVTPGRLAWWAALAAAGPLTGPLIAGLVRSWRNGDRILAGLYAIAIPLVWLALTGLAGTSVAQLLKAWAQP